MSELTDEGEMPSTDLNDKKTLFIANSGGFSHTLRLLSMAEEVALRLDSEVMFACTSEQADFGGTVGLQSPSIVPVKYEVSSNSTPMSKLRVFEDLHTETNAEMVVVDQDPTAILAIGKLGIRGAMVLNTLHLPLHRGIAGEEDPSLPNRVVAEFANHMLRKLFREHVEAVGLKKWTSKRQSVILQLLFLSGKIISL